MIYRLGLFGSGGYERFLVPLGPVVAVAAAEALSDVLAAPHRQHSWIALGGVLLLWVSAEAEFVHCWPVVVRHHAEWTRIALRGGGAFLVAVCLVAATWSLGRGRASHRLAAGIVPATLLLIAVAQPYVATRLPVPVRHCAPLVLTARQQSYRAAVDWLRTNGRNERPCVAASPWFDAFLGRTRPPQGPLAAAEVAGMRPGDILLWDAREFASPRHGLTLDALRQRDDFRELWSSGGDAVDPVFCVIFERRAQRSSLDTRATRG